MNQIDKENAIYKIDGYYLPDPRVSSEILFTRAKQECIKNLMKQLKQIEEIEISDFIKRKKKI